MLIKRLFLILTVLTVLLVQGIVCAKEISDSQNELEVRAFHFVLRNVAPDKANWMIDVAAKSGFNAVLVLLTDGVRFDKAPWAPMPNAWSKNEFLNWVNYARSRGIEVIPELKLLTHQEKFMQTNLPQLMFNALTYDPRNDKVYDIVFALLDEVIELVKPKAIHIGHDELAGRLFRNKLGMLRPAQLRKGESALTANLFLQDVLKIHNYLRSKNIDTWMWGDMLLTPSEFPNMKEAPLHGTLPGYGTELRKMLPRDLVICDWHYYETTSDFHSLLVFKNEGFRVLAAVWKDENTTRNFIRYAISYNAYGAIATTWFHVQKGDWDVVKWILQTAGSLFRNPNAILAGSKRTKPGTSPDVDLKSLDNDLY